MPRARQSIEVDASPGRMMEVITDFGRYSQYLPEIEQVEVLRQEKDEWEVRFRVRVIRRLEYTLLLIRESPMRLTWSLVTGVFRANQGAWDLEALPDGRTRATYSIDITFGLFVPGALVKTLVGRNLPDTLARFRKQAELDPPPAAG
jgi:coenzyme Q-binding protein COQ10